MPWRAIMAHDAMPQPICYQNMSENYMNFKMRNLSPAMLKSHSVSSLNVASMVSVAVLHLTEV